MKSLNAILEKKLVRFFVIFFALLFLMDAIGETLVLLVIGSWFLANVPWR